MDSVTSIAIDLLTARTGPGVSLLPSSMLLGLIIILGLLLVSGLLLLA